MTRPSDPDSVVLDAHGQVLEDFAKAIENDKTIAGMYPSSAATANNGKGLTSGSGNTVAYNVDGAGTTFCLQVSKQGSASYFATQANLAPTAGACAGVIGIAVGGGAIMQTITNANCPTSRTRGVDARDGRTYWVQQLADGKCWMLTNLAYSGGGSNTYGDAKTLTIGTIGASTYTVATYYVPPGANPTTEPTDPSTSTDGGATNPQYGYFYNWCGAMGGQATDACDSSYINAPNPNVSICPAGWRLPTGNGGEFGTLNAAVNGGSTSTDAGLRNTWLAQLSGAYWGDGNAAHDQGSKSSHWSSTRRDNNSAYLLHVETTLVSSADGDFKRQGRSVRCLAS